MAWLSQELAENSIATLIDFVSILFAYNLGVSQLGITVGLLYAAFDAYVVIWMRRRITGWVRRFFGLLRRRRAAVIIESQGKGMS